MFANTIIGAGHPRKRRPSALPLAYGRFLEADPIGYEDNANLYAYVHNDPVNLTDPLGLKCDEFTTVCGKRPPQPCGKALSQCGTGSSPPANQYPGGGIGANPGDGGGGGGKVGDPPVTSPPASPPPKKQFTCDDAMNERGEIRATGVAVTAVLGLGWTVTRGSWINLSTGAAGTFTTTGFAAGLEAGAGGSTVTYDSMGAFTGWSDGYSAGLSTGIPGLPFAVGGSFTHSSNDSGSGSGGFLGVSPTTPFPSAGASGNFTETTISQCKPGG